MQRSSRQGTLHGWQAAPVIERMQGLNSSVYGSHNRVTVIVGEFDQMPANVRRDQWHVSRNRQCPALHPPQTSRKAAQGPLIRFIVRYAVDSHSGAPRFQFQVGSTCPTTAQGRANLRVIGKNERMIGNGQQPLDHV
ncbi:MAG: hypothetical protein OXL39_11555 [Caldilineaceae bacterium]|nr:hypothetical protein [Caldilineaceae bacterium]